MNLTVLQWWHKLKVSHQIYVMKVCGCFMDRSIIDANKDTRYKSEVQLSRQSVGWQFRGRKSLHIAVIFKCKLS